MSSSQVTEQLEATGVDPAEIEEVDAIYASARVDAFRSGVAFLLFIALVGLVLTMGLPNRMLAEQDEPGPMPTA